ncbi:hypothetical protein [Neobacillus niacini]|nr:hypothetical protein [Neobacillus niacini]
MKKPKDLSFIQVMKDKTHEEAERFVLHPGHEGQNSRRGRKICPSSRQ